MTAYKLFDDPSSNCSQKKLKMQRIISCSLVVIILSYLTLGCKARRKIETIRLEKSPHQLTKVVDGRSLPISFGFVKAIDLDDFGNLYVLDAKDCRVYKFTVDGKMVNYWGKKGLGPAEFSNPRALCVVGDSLVYVFHEGRIDITDLDGNFQRRVVTHSTYDAKVTSNGQIIFNHQDRSYTSGYCLSVHTPNSKLITNFRKSLNRKYKTTSSDVGFMDLNSNDEIVYFQAFLDSIFVYDLAGRILKQSQQNLGFKLKSLTPEKQIMLNDDIFIDRNDHIFVLRVFREDEEGSTYVRIIDEYDAHLQLVRSYKLPKPITLSIGFNVISPWYHKFAKRGDQFLFFVSKPKDHLEVYVPKALTEKESEEKLLSD